MSCPHCSGAGSKVIDSRDSGDGVRRRRECLYCARRFTTYERVHRRAMTIVKRDGRREEFERDKLYSSIVKACAKRPLPVGGIEKAVGEIENRLSESGRSEIPSRAVGELVMERLADLDRVAYIRFASVYLDFGDIEAFKKAIEDIMEPADAPPADAPRRARPKAAPRSATAAAR